MFYQALISPQKSYVATLSTNCEYPAHWHSEIELLYVLVGELSIKSNGKLYVLKEGDLFVAMCDTPHETIVNQENLTLFVEFGYSLLGSKFHNFKNRALLCPHIHSDKIPEALREAIINIVNAKKFDPDSITTDWIIQSNILSIASLLYNESFEDTKKEKSNIDTMYPALEYIHNHYMEPISLLELANETGYDTAYFCRQFKSIIGTTAHNYINYYKIEMACRYLGQSNMSVNDISSKTGFQSSIQFCRVFKSYMKMTPTYYRSLNPINRPNVKPL